MIKFVITVSHQFTRFLGGGIGGKGLIYSQVLGKGATVVFEATNANYLFIQGGATDTLVEINEAGALSGITTVTVANSSVSIAFNGN